MKKSKQTCHISNTLLMTGKSPKLMGVKKNQEMYNMGTKMVVLEIGGLKF